ncbi:MAG: DUF4280 domain-containing protein [Syntrophaceae bacterium]|nr:DUF4280 domain-containing protein [Syntrophaceae bacterium]
MPGYLLQQGATVLCMHGGQSQPVTTNMRVKVSGQPVVTQQDMYSISGCPFMSGSNPMPCVTGQWTSAATRVKAGGLPVILQDSQAVCTPNGTGFNILVTQIRVKGQ